LTLINKTLQRELCGEWLFFCRKCILLRSVFTTVRVVKSHFDEFSALFFRAWSIVIYPQGNMCAVVVVYELIVVCVCFTNVRALRVNRLNQFMTATTAADAYAFGSTTSDRPAENRLEDIDVKGLLDTIKKLSRTKTFANAAVSDG